jgi:pyrroloquinoline quinone biosynthesis protein E
VSDAPESRPKIAASARLVWDRRGARHVLLYPERGLALNEVSAAIVRAADGTRTRAEIAAEIARAFEGAPREQIARDVDAFLDELAARGLVDASPSLRREGVRRAAPAAPEEGLACLVAELTYRCPLRCPYCSNPVALERGDELSTSEWKAVLDGAAAEGALHVHFTGGEPLARADLEGLVAHARGLGLYSNLVTSGVPLARARLEAIAAAGIDHVQLSVQAPDAAASDAIAGLESHAHKLEVARWVKELGLPLTINTVVVRANVGEVERVVDLAVDLGADRLELANVQLLGWALENRAALLPERASIDAAFAVAEAARARLAGRLEIVFVLPDYVAGRPRACMDGWGRRYALVDPFGFVLPCHQARSITTLAFERIGARSFSDIWRTGEALTRYRGEAWMKEPCRSCERRALDFGGCRCQAFALTGEAAATDPACELAPSHGVVAVANAAARGSHAAPRYLFRGFPTAR